MYRGRGGGEREREILCVNIVNCKTKRTPVRWFNMIIRVHVEGKEKNVLRYTVTQRERKIEREREHSSTRAPS